MQGASTQNSALLRALWIMLGLLVAALVALLVWQAVDGGEDEDETPATPGGARIVSPAELSKAAASGELPVYWVGPRPGAELELSEVSGRRAYVRYLTGGAEAGDPKSSFLAIGTYRLPKALAVLKLNAKRTGTKLRKGPHGARVWVDPKSPTSAYVARPGGSVQIEVYDPSAKQALGIALSSRLRPVIPG